MAKKGNKSKTKSSNGGQSANNNNNASAKQQPQREREDEELRDAPDVESDEDDYKQLTVNQLCAKAEAALAKFDFEKSLKYYERALAKQPQNTAVMDALGALLLDLNQVERAAELFDTSIRIAPEKHHGKYMYLGQISEGQEAIEYFKKGIQVLHKNKQKFINDGKLAEYNQAIVSASCSIAEIYMTDACFEENAEQECERALLEAMKCDKDNYELLQTMASFRMSQCNPDEADKCMTKVLSIIEKLDEDDMPSYEFRISTSKILMELGRYAESEALLERLSLENDQVVDTWYLLGVCCSLQSDNITAEEHLAKALSLAKKLGEDPEFIQEIQAQFDEVRPQAELERQQLANKPIEKDDDESEEDEDDDETMA